MATSFVGHGCFIINSVEQSLVEYLIPVQLIRAFSAFCGNPTSIAVFSRDLHYSLS
jgi:hypothetical protein